MLGASLFQLLNNSASGPAGPSVTAKKGLGRVQDAEQAYLDQIQQTPQFQGPADPVNPAWRTQDAIKGVLGAAIAKAVGGDAGLDNFLVNYVGGKQDEANKKTALAEKKRLESNQQIKTAYELGNKVKEAELQFAQDAQAREQREIERMQNEKSKADLQRERLDEQNLRQAENDYRLAKSEVGMLQAAQRRAAIQQRMGLEVTPVDPQLIAQDWAERSAAARNTILDNWNGMINKSLTEYGVIQGGTAESLAKARDVFAKDLEMYGAQNAKDLLIIPTEATLKKQKQDEYLSRMADKLKIDKDRAKDQHLKTLQDIAKSKAEIERAKERIAIARRSNDIRAFNADTARMNSEKRNVDDKVNKQIRSLTVQIEGLRAKQKKLAEQGNIAGAQGVEAEISKLAAQRDAWRQEIEGPPEDPDKITADSGFTTQTRSGIKFSFKP